MRYSARLPVYCTPPVLWLITKTKTAGKNFKGRVYLSHNSNDTPNTTQRRQGHNLFNGIAAKIGRLTARQQLDGCNQK